MAHCCYSYHHQLIWKAQRRPTQFNILLTGMFVCGKRKGSIWQTRNTPCYPDVGYTLSSVTRKIVLYIDKHRTDVDGLLRRKAIKKRRARDNVWSDGGIVMRVIACNHWLTDPATGCHCFEARRVSQALLKCRKCITRRPQWSRGDLNGDRNRPSTSRIQPRLHDALHIDMLYTHLTNGLHTI